MEKYLIYKDVNDMNRNFLRTIYRSSISEDNDIGEAIEFDNKELALLLADFLNKRENEKYKVMLVKTTMEEVVE